MQPPNQISAQVVQLAAVPDSDRRLVALEQRKERDEQFEKTTRRRDSALGNTSRHDKTSENSNLSNMKADNFS